MRILHVAETAKGGIGTHVRELCIAQAADFGWDHVRALVPDEHRSELPELPDDRVAVFSRRSRGLSSILSLAGHVRHELNAFKPDILHLHSSLAGAVGRVMRLMKFGRSKPACIFCPNGWSFSMDTHVAKQFTYARLESALAKMCDAVVCVSEKEIDAASAVGIPRKKCRLIYNGVRPQAPEPAKLPQLDEHRAWRDSGGLLLAFVGRIDKQKGFDRACHLFAQLPADKFRLLVVGAPFVGDASTPANIPSNMYSLGWQNAEGVQTALEACDALFVPSRWEGFPFVAIEAMRASRAIIATPAGGLSEAIDHGKTGYIVDPDQQDRWPELFHSLSRDGLMDLGRAGKERFLAHYTSSVVHRQTLDVYHEVLQARHVGHRVPSPVQ